MESDKLKDKIESKFRRGFAGYQEGFYRPDEYSPEQIGWDAAEAVEKLRKDFLNKALNDFRNTTMLYRITRIKTAPDKKDRQGYYLEALNELEALTKFYDQFPGYVGEELELEEWS